MNEIKTKILDKALPVFSSKPKTNTFKTKGWRFHLEGFLLSPDRSSSKPSLNMSGFWGCKFSPPKLKHRFACSVVVKIKKNSASGGLMVIYHDRIRKESAQPNPSDWKRRPITCSECSPKLFRWFMNEIPWTKAPPWNTTKAEKTKTQLQSLLSPSDRLVD